VKDKEKKEMEADEIGTLEGLSLLLRKNNVKQNCPLISII